jgi:prepilin-type N-terminal cleavage/methylation domain-containing protein
MIAKQRSFQTTSVRRAAFTLIEVLVVVTIVVILASVGTIATLKYLDDAKEDNAIMTMQALEQAAKTWEVKNGGTQLTDISELVPYLEKGQQQLQDPWGGIYQFGHDDSMNTGNPRIFFFTTNPKTGLRVQWPRN